jgi:redox-sensitive bicupin YhaK (pirin superfamily)
MARREFRRQQTKCGILCPSTAGATQRRSIASVTPGVLFAQAVRLCTPADFGQSLKPFVCLEYEPLYPHARPHGHPRPYSGMAVLHLVLSGAVRFDDTTGNDGRLAAGGVAWLMSGCGAWQAAAPRSETTARIFRLGIALPPELEGLSAQSQYVAPSAAPQKGPVRVILGRYGTVAGALDTPPNVNVFHVQLHGGQRWLYSPPTGQTTSWIVVDRGRLRAQCEQSLGTIHQGELAIFEEAAGGMIAVQSEGTTSFIVGSSSKHPYPLIFDRFSVHTEQGAMTKAKGVIARAGRKLLARGRIP